MPAFDICPDLVFDESYIMRINILSTISETSANLLYGWMKTKGHNYSAA